MKTPVFVDIDDSYNIDVGQILILGGSGVLGQAIRNRLAELLIVHIAPSHEELDVTSDNIYISSTYDAILYLAGMKDQEYIESHGQEAMWPNIFGLINVVSNMHENQKLVYISTGYVYKDDKSYHKETDGLYPCNRYAWSKLGGECVVKMLPEEHHLIIRCEFSKKPWHRETAYNNQFTSREEVTTTAKKIVNLISKKAYGTYNVGGKRHSILEYANSISDKEIEEVQLYHDENPLLPRDTSLNTDKYTTFMEEHK